MSTKVPFEKNESAPYEADSFVLATKQILFFTLFQRGLV